MATEEVPITVGATKYGSIENHEEKGAKRKNDKKRHHEQESVEQSKKKEARVLLTACILCFVFMCAEIAGGILAGSIAILTDAAHLLSDLAGMLIGVAAIYLSQHPATGTMTYGYHRAEILGALASIALVWVMTGILIFEACRRLQDPPEVDGKLMFIIATLGLFINVAMAYVLGGIEDSHSHGHSHAGIFNQLGYTAHDTHSDHDSDGHSHHSHGHSHDDSHSHHDDNHSHHDDTHSHHDDTHSHHSHDSHGHGHGHSSDDDSDHSHGHGHGHGHGHSDSHGSESKEAWEMKKIVKEIERAHSRRFYTGHDNHGHDHGHGHGKSPKRNNGKRVGGNVQAALIHVIGDLIQSVGVMIAAGVIWYNPKWNIVDPICTFFFALIVLYTTWDTVRSQIHILMEGAPGDAEDIKNKLALIKDVESVHCFHVWTLTSGKLALTAHLLTKKVSDTKILKIAGAICQAHGVEHTTFQVEFVNEHETICDSKCHVYK